MFLYQDFFGAWHTAPDNLIPPATWFVRVDRVTLPSLLHTLQAAFGKEAVQQALNPTPSSGAYEETHP